MLKFLRKYNKFLLAGFGSVLLLTWLVPSAVTEFARRSGATNATWATLGDGEVVTMGQMQQLQRQMKVLEALNVPLLANLGGGKDPAMWFLLVREARQAGLVGGMSDGQRLLESMGGGAKVNDMVGRLCAISGMQPPAVLETLAELQGVGRMLTMTMNAARLSDVRQENKAAEAMSGVSADIAVISASQPLPKDDPAPTPERMQALLKEFASVEPGKGRAGMGYRQPDRVSLEWLTVPASAVRASLENDPSLSGVNLRKAFLKNPVQYGAAADATFEAFKDKVKAAELDRLTADRMNEVAKFVDDQTMMALRKFPKDGIYAKLPEGGAGVPSLADLATALASQFGMPAPQVQRTSLMAPTELAATPGLGSASTTRFGTQAMSVVDVVEQAREFKPAQVKAPVQAGVTGPALRGQGTVPTDVFAFRILETVPAHDAKDLEEIRGQLADDAVRTMRFEVLEKDRAAIEAAAKADLAAMAAAHGVKVEFAPGIREADANMMRFGLKIPTALPGVGQDPELTRQILRRALALPADLSKVPDAERTFVLTSPDRMALVAVKVRELFPVAREDYQEAAANPRFRASLMDDGAPTDNLVKSFGPDALKLRAGFKPAREEHHEDDGSAEPAKAG